MDAAIGRHHVVACVDQPGEGGGNGLLPRHGPIAEQELARREPRLDRFIHSTYPRHLPIDLEQNRWLDAEVRLNALLHDKAPDEAEAEAERPMCNAASTGD